MSTAVNVPESTSQQHWHRSVWLVCGVTLVAHAGLLMLWPAPESEGRTSTSLRRDRSTGFADTRELESSTPLITPHKESIGTFPAGHRHGHSATTAASSDDPQVSEPGPFQPPAMPLPLVQQEPDSSEVTSKLPDLPLDADPIRLPPSGMPVTKPEPSRVLSPRQQAARQERREVIKAELPRASEEELSIWIDQFEGVPLESIRDLIRLRQQFPVGLPQTGGKDAAVSDNTSDAPLVEGNSPLHISSIPGNTSQHGMDSTEFSPSSPSGEVLRTGDVIEAVSPEIRALRAAQQVLRQNMAQAKTLGYRRRIVHLEPIDGGSADAPTASFRVSVLIDPSPGTWTITDRPLDIAIQGYGWLVVRDGAQRLLTRVGHLSVLENRQLGVKRGAKSYPLDPPVTLPEDYQRILINEDGAVSIATSANGEMSMTGQITLATVADAATLKEVQTGLFSTTIECGPISIETTSPLRAGKLISGRLELSNVDTEAELERHRELDDQISLLRTAWEESLSRLNWQRAE